MAEDGLKHGNKSTEAARAVTRLSREWYEWAHRAKQSGKCIAWCMLGVPPELLWVFDIEPVWPENYGALCAAKGDAVPFLQTAEDEGYSADICSYVRNALGYASLYNRGAVPPEAPRGGMPGPDLLLTISSGCDPRTKFFQALASRYLSIPAYACNWHNPPYGTDFTDESIKRRYIQYNMEELRALVAFLGKETGRKLDETRLSEALVKAWQAKSLFYQVHELRKSVPCPMPSEDVFACVIPQLYFPHRPEALGFYKALYDEVRYRVDHGIGVIPEEKYRLMWIGLPPWFNMGIFNYLESLGAVSVWETSYYVADPIGVDFSDPLRGIAEQAWIRAVKASEFSLETCQEPAHTSGRYQGMPPGLIQKMAQDYKINGVIMHSVMSCRAVSFGQIHLRNELAKRKVPCLFLESDMADPRLWSDTQIKAQINTFLEMVEVAKH